MEDMSDSVHVYKKLSYVMKDGTGVCLNRAKNQPKPPRVQNKRFITKYTFLGAVARPSEICNGVWFDGKTGIWPMMDTV
ncbi:unnamed protein product [Discosporangium mesarthrocarpum]